MSDVEKGALWVRYLGSKTIHRAEVFTIPTDKVPQKIKQLKARGDVAQIWYSPGVELVANPFLHWDYQNAK